MIENLLTWFRENIFPRSANESPRLPPQASEHSRSTLQQALKSTAEAKHKMPAKTRAKKPTEIDPDELVYDHVVGGQLEDLGPGKNVLKRSKYIREDAGTHDNLKIFEEGLLEVAEDDSGIDPYNTGQFDRSESWNKRSRE